GDADRLAHARVELVRQRRRSRLTGRVGAEVGELPAREQAFVDRDLDAQRRQRSAIMIGYSRSPGSSACSSVRPACRNDCKSSASGTWLAPTFALSPLGVIPDASVYRPTAR